MRSSCFIIIIILIFCSYLYPDSGAEFINIGVNPRAIALGNAYSAAADDSSAVYWNPAGLNRIFDAELFFMHQKWLFETDLEFLSAAKRFKYGVFGLSLSYFHMPEFELLGSRGENMGNASVYDLLWTSSYANKYKGILYGMNLKYIRRVMDKISSSAYACDTGLIYGLNLLKSYKSPAPNFFLSFSIKNLGTKFQYETEAESLPLTFTTGFKYIFFSRIQRKLFLSSDISYRIDEPIIFGAGMEYNFFSMLFIRLGYKYEDQQSQIMAGAGISYDISTFNVNFDMALFRFNEETMYPYSLGIRSSMNKSIRVSRVDLKKNVETVNILAKKNKTIIGFINFKNLSGKGEWDYLSSTIPESVNTILSKNTNLIIIATEKINSELGKIQINDEDQYNYVKLYNKLGISHLITGSYMEMDNMIKVNLKIIEVKDNKFIYGKSIDGQAGKNVFSLIDKIASDLSSFYEKK